MKHWVPGNRFHLLENGEAFYPRVFEVIAAARQEVMLETFIVFEDKVGGALHEALLAAARRGAQVDILLDGFGSADLTPDYLGPLLDAGVRVHWFDPSRRVLGWRPNFFRRMHRKLVVVDGQRAFVGGINYSADHLSDYGPEAKQDYAVEVEGPLVAHIHRFMRRTIEDGTPGRTQRWLRRRFEPPPGTAHAAAGDADALFVWRDNGNHRNDIERHYRIAIRAARRRVIVANAYFFPGYRLLREMRRAARRGVEVSLILQGKPDMPIVKTAAEMLYRHLLQSGVRIHEYCKRPLHAKVAVVDDVWSTVGSSNLDPLSLSLNLEANVVIRNRAFNQTLGGNLEALIAHSCREVGADALEETGWWARLRSNFVFHFLRHYPSWAGWLPAHAPRLQLAQAKAQAAMADAAHREAGAPEVSAPEGSLR